jgi:hypothetical protein
MRTRALGAALAVAAALAGAGCGRDLDQAKVATSDLNAEQQAALRHSRLLTAGGGPAPVVLTFLRDVADAAGPAAIAFYDRRVRGRVGEANLLGALDVMTDMTKETLPVVVRRRNTRAGLLVVVRLLQTSQVDQRHAFLLRREGGGWRIVYDSLLAKALGNYLLATRSPDPARPTPAARAAATRAVSALRLLALEPPPGGGSAAVRQARPR